MSVARNTFYNIAGASTSVVVAVVTVPLYLDQIGAARYGVLALIWLLLGYFGLFDMGLSRATANHVAKASDAHPVERENIFWTASLLNAGFGVVGGVALYFAAGPLLGHWFKMSPALHVEAMDALPWIAIAVPVATISSVMSGALIGRERFDALNVLQAGGTLLFHGAPLLAAYAIGPQLSIVVPVAVIARCVTVLPLMIAVKVLLPLKHVPRLHRRWVRGLLGYGAWVTITNAISPILTSIDRFLIGAVLGAPSVAYYDVPYRMVGKVQLLPAALSQAIFPRLSVEKDQQSSGTSIRAIGVLNGVLTPLVTAAIVLSFPAMTVWVGAPFARQAAPVAVILLVGVWINSLAYIPFTKLQGGGRPDMVAKIHLVQVAPFLFVLWWALHRFGLIGAAAAWTVRVATDAALQFWVSGLGARVLRPLVPSAVMVALAALVALTPTRVWVSATISLFLVGCGAVWGIRTSDVLRSELMGRAKLMGLWFRRVLRVPSQ